MGASAEDRWSGVGAEYEGWLARQPLSANTKRAYRTRVSQYLEYLAATPVEYGDPLEDFHARDYAVRDYKGHLKAVRKAKPSSVNLSLAAIDNFYLFLGMGRPVVRREELAQTAPRSLSGEEQKRFLRAVERSSEIRDKAIALLLFYGGLRISELCGLEVEDVALSARKGRVVVRSGKGDSYREVVLNSEVREALSGWLADRKGWSGSEERAALFLSRRGGRLSTRAVDLIVRKLGEEANLDRPLSAHALRHTCVTNLVRAGADLVLVAEIAGHRRLETTRRYSLPSAADREAAMEGIRVEY
ncbi:MAG: tyrosine-type recombinase/integrase [Actinomycetota bacterium]|nr:tyrosine-type recombinase/integrase [Actinomycetota bacterium]MDP9475140.1 tyrosine-type recombinase/integrase [Actinomycetota bacterium]MDP9484475.1 tyrosine-type recombinase/integrase [Actinomycetota bacterium]